MKRSAYAVKHVPVLMIGSGISGLFAALKLSKQGIRVLLLTKSTLSQNNSRYAQGGIAAVLPENAEDSLALHLADTIRAGAGLCDEEMAEKILAEGYPAIADLLMYGVPFDRGPEDQLAVTLEAGHSTRRIIHAGGDATGKLVETTLINKVRADANIEVMEFCQVTELLTRDGACVGARAVSYQEEKEWLILAESTILATGGAGRLYSHTTNPAGATGDGMALAYQAGVTLEDMEFIQFHPTAFYQSGSVHFLISEALRGEGGILRNAHGEAFAAKYHPDAELAPRDVVTRAIYSEMEAEGLNHVYLDITHLPVETIETRFPTILASCLLHGIDIRTDQIPVAPAAHYMMGGIAVDAQAKSELDGLYVIGESACTGLHGANRLASNSLLECCVLARHAASAIVGKRRKARLDEGLADDFAPAGYCFAPAESVNELLEERLDALHRLMWSKVGIIRNEERLSAAMGELSELLKEAEAEGWSAVVPMGAEYFNQLLLGRVIAQAALQRRESRGAQFRTDYPQPLEVAQHSYQYKADTFGGRAHVDAIWR